MKRKQYCVLVGFALGMGVTINAQSAWYYCDDCPQVYQDCKARGSSESHCRDIEQWCYNTCRDRDW